jgi:hypothetical protein
LGLSQKFEQLESLLRQELKDFEEKSTTQFPKILNEFEFPRTSVTKLIRKEYAKVSGDDASYAISTIQSRESFPALFRSVYLPHRKPSPTPSSTSRFLRIGSLIPSSKQSIAR